MFKGIDVSGHNGIVNWEQAKAAGLNFALLRCGFGQDEASQNDSQFARNASECERLGIPYGVYLYSYALHVEGVTGEVNHVLRLLRGRKPSYPIYIDMEDADGYKAKHGMPSKQTTTDIIKAFCSQMEKAGYYVGWYANKDWCINHLYADQLKNYTFWFARPAVDKPDLNCAMWQSQFGETGGRFAGVNGGCDLDVSYEDFDAIIKKAGLNGYGKNTPATPVNPTPVTPAPQPAIEHLNNTYGTVTADVLNVRNGAGTNHSVIGQLKKGAKVKLDFKSNGWWSIYFGDHGGFVSADYISVGGSAPASTPAPASNNYYTVKSGDTLSGIASKYGTTYQHLAEINCLSDPNKIYAGQKLKVTGSATYPASSSIVYTVQGGDSLSRIASKYHTTYQHLAQINGIADPNKIYVGQKIKIQ